MNQNCWLFRPYPHSLNRLNNFIELNLIAVGWPGLGDLSASDRKDIESRVQAKYGEEGLSNVVNTLFAFKENIKIDDIIIVVPKANDSCCVAIGQVTSDYFFNPKYDDYDIGYSHQRQVAWIEKRQIRKELPKAISEKLGFRKTFIKLSETLSNSFVEFLKSKNYTITHSERPESHPTEKTVNFAGFRLIVQNYRVLKAVDLEAHDVSLIVGANGSGKSTLLKSLTVLKNTIFGGFGYALNQDGGPQGFQHFNFKNAPTLYSLQMNGIQWEISPEVNNDGVKHPLPERIKLQGDLCAKVVPGNTSFLYRYVNFSVTQEKTALQKISEAEVYAGELDIFIQALSHYRYYHDYQLKTLRYSGSPLKNDTELHPNGLNAFDVLRTWQSDKPFTDKYQFIRETLQDTFPFFQEIGFESAGQTVSLKIYTGEFHIPLLHVSNGFLVFLLHLMAICSAPTNSIVSIDEPENGLHPYAIKQLIAACRQWSALKNMTILLATHSPFMLNEFDGSPEKVFVIGAEDDSQLARLDELRDPEWLSFYSLGDLYGTEFGI
jgi:predicted ATPase